MVKRFLVLLLIFPTLALATELDTDSNNAVDMSLGGTNATTAAEARTNLDVYSKAEVDAADDTGTDDQTASEVSISDSGDIITATDVEGALQENRTAINLNTAKTTNATHTGDVTGSTALTIQPNVVEENMLKVVNTPTDEDCFTYEETTGDFEWQTCTTGSVTWDELGDPTGPDTINFSSTQTISLGTGASIKFSDGGSNNIEIKNDSGVIKLLANGETTAIYGTLADDSVPDSALETTDQITVRAFVGGAPLSSGVVEYRTIEYAATITQATIICDQTGSIVFDVWVDSYANALPTDADSITASAPPTVSSAVKSQDATLTGWTTSLSAGDVIGVNIDSASTVTMCTLNLKLTR